MQALPLDVLLKEIRLLQGIQKAHTQSHPEWRKASDRLAPRFAEVARRAAAGDADALAARL